MASIRRAHFMTISFIYIIVLFAQYRAVFSQDPPVLIVGAGVAGSKVAYELSKAEIPFLVLEAHERVGGRLATGRTTPDGINLELGANWLHELSRGQKFARLALSKVGLRALRHSSRQDTVLLRDGEEVPDKELDAAEAVFREPVRGKLQSLIDQAAAGSIKISSEQALREVGIKIKEPVQAAVLRDWIDYAYSVPAKKLNLAELYIPGGSTRASVRQHENDRRRLRVPINSSIELDAVTRDEVRDGVGSLTHTEVDYFVKDQRGYRAFVTWHLTQAGIQDVTASSDKLLLNAPVTKINYGSQPFVELADGTKINGGVIVCTVSLGVLKASVRTARQDKLRQGVIAFEPELGSAKIRAIKMLGMGHYTKYFVSFSEPVLTKNDKIVYSPVVEGEHSFIALMNLNARGYFPGANTLLFTAVDKFAKRLVRMSESERIEAALQFFETVFKQKVDRTLVTGSIMTPFRKDPYIRGSFSFVPPRFTYDIASDLRRAVGNLYFAGEAFDDVEVGSVDGAWRSGASTAAEVINEWRR